MTEKQQAEYFFKYLFDGDIVNLTKLKNDPPDFEFNHNGKLCGLEHT